MQVEDVLKEVGSFGTYQKLLCFLLIPITTGICGLTYYSQIFILIVPKHHCRQFIPVRTNTSYFPIEFSNESENSLSEAFTGTKFNCHQFTTYDLEKVIQGLKNGSSPMPIEPSEECTNGWEFEYETMFPTVTSEHGWICEKAYKPYLIITCFWIGNTIGAWIFGSLSDRFGRRQIITLSLLVYGASGVASAFVADHFYLFLLLRFLVGSAHHTVSHLPFILVVEYCGIKSRVVPLFTIMASYTLASILAPVLALTIWNWKILTIVTSLPALFLLLFHRWFPESISWMITKNRTARTLCRLESVAQINNILISRENVVHKLSIINSTTSGSLSIHEENSSSTPSLLKILKFPNLRRNVFVYLIVCMISCMCYYGHCQNTVNIGSGIFTNYVLGASIEIPAWSVPYLIHKYGRKGILLAAFLLSGISGGVYAILPLHYENTILAFALLGRMFITGAYYVTLQHGREIFPTLIRGRGVAMSETLGGIAIFVSPLVVYLGEFRPNLPLIIFSSLSIVGGLATIILPETKGRALPQTFLEAEAFSYTASSSCGCFKRSRQRNSENPEENKFEITVRDSPPWN